MVFLVRRFVLCVGPLFLFLFLLPGCSGKSPPDPVYIGHLAAQTGPEAAIGKHAEQGILLAIEEANQQENWVAGRPVAVRHVDIGGNPKTAQQQAARLIALNKVVALLANIESAPAESLGLQLQSYKVPVVVTAGLTSPPTSKYLFAVGLPPSSAGHALARFVAEKLQKTPLALLTPSRGAVPSALADAIVAKLGKEHVKTWTYEGAAVASAEGSRAAGEEDRAQQRATAMEQMAKDVKAQAPRTILVLGTAGDCLHLRAALRKAGVDPSVPFLFGGGEDSLTALAASGPPAEGIYAVTAFCLDSHDPRAQEIARSLPRAQTFVTTYQAQFRETPDAQAALAYDGARFLFEAMRAARGFDGEKLEEQLSGLQNDFETLTGPLPRRPAFLVQIRGGLPELVEMYPAP